MRELLNGGAVGSKLFGGHGTVLGISNLIDEELNLDAGSGAVYSKEVLGGLVSVLEGSGSVF